MLKPSFPFFRSTLAVAATTIALGLLAGCRIQVNHPGQISSFDGAAYDALTLTHGALSSLRAPVITTYPKLAGTYNRVADAYDRAVEMYKLFRTHGSSESTLSVALADVVVALGSLEVDLQGTLNVPADRTEARAAQHRLAARNAKARLSGAFSIQTLMAELQVAATIATAVRGDDAQMRAANVILQATREAVTEWDAVANQPINTASLASIELIALQPAE
jgi:hypothetical protein